MTGPDLLARFECRFHHLGVACRSIDQEARWWSALGYSAEGDDFADVTQHVRGRFMVGAGPRLELLSPLAAGSPLDLFLERGVKLYHQAFETPCFDQVDEAMRGAGCRAASAAAPAVAFAGRRIVFYTLPNMNLIEFIEAER